MAIIGEAASAAQAQAMFNDVMAVPAAQTVAAFRVQNQRLMLTYKGHLDKERLMAFIEGLHPCAFIRCAHETGAHEDGGEDYPHTHVLLDFGKIWQTRDCRKLDFDGVHPNIKPVKSAVHFRNGKEYLAKEDPANADLKGSGVPMADACWRHESLQEALRKVETVSEVMGTIALYNAAPKEDYKSPPPREWRPWQAGMIAKLSEPADDRTIMWIYDEKGAGGKSLLARYIGDYMNGILITQMGGQKDTATLLEGEPSLSDRPIVVDLSRSSKEKEIYDPLEHMKDGSMNSVKYRGQRLRWRPGHVLVMANFRPDYTKLSRDRYRTYVLTEAGLTLESPLLLAQSSVSVVAPSPPTP